MANINRQAYLDNEISYDIYCQHVVDLLGRKSLEAIVKRIAPLDQLCQSTDPHLNNIPLDRWDRYHGAVLALVKHEHMAVTWCGQPLAPRQIVWSRGDSVCVLKAAARRMIDEAKRGDDDDTPVGL